jgi:hypothetical protein
MRLRSKKEEAEVREGEARDARGHILGEGKRKFGLCCFCCCCEYFHRWLGLEFMRCISLEEGVFFFGLSLIKDQRRLLCLEVSTASTITLQSQT